jgi:hypothetical protein
MNIQQNANGVIINADKLIVDDVVNKQVLCPACAKHEFKHWPYGWDAHSAFVCDGVSGATPAKRKEAFKTRYRHLFR